MRPHSGPSTRIRAVVVDDSAVTLQTISSFLSRQSAVEVVGTAQDGAAAIEIVRKLKPDVVLMDVQMPGMNGLEATAEILREFPSMRVVMITVNDTPELRQAANEIGAARFVPKPQLWRVLPQLLRELAQEDPTS
jgi:two-component system, NarL family, response regulator LiaR